MNDNQATDFLAACASAKCRQRCWSARASSTSRSMRSLKMLFNALDLLAALASVKCRQRCWSARASSTSRSMRSLWRQAPPRTQSTQESWQVGGWGLDGLQCTRKGQGWNGWQQVWRQAPPRTRSMRESWQVGGWVRMVAQGEGTRGKGAGMGWLVTGMVASCGGFCRHPPHYYCHVHHIYDLCALTAPDTLCYCTAEKLKAQQAALAAAEAGAAHYDCHTSAAPFSLLAPYSLLSYCRKAQSAAGCTCGSGSHCSHHITLASS